MMETFLIISLSFPKQKILPWIQSTLIKTRIKDEDDSSTILSVSTIGKVATISQRTRGLYKVVLEETHNNRPVWKHFRTNFYLFYSDEGYWKISEFKSEEQVASPITFRSIERGLPFVPEKNWQYYDGKNWLRDENFIITRGAPKLPVFLRDKRKTSFNTSEGYRACNLLFTLELRYLP